MKVSIQLFAPIKRDLSRMRRSIHSKNVSIQLFAPIKRDLLLLMVLNFTLLVSIQLFAPIKRDEFHKSKASKNGYRGVYIQLFAPIKRDMSEVEKNQDKFSIGGFHSIVCPY